MGKRKGRRAYLRKDSMGYVKVRKGLDPTKTAAFDAWSKHLTLGEIPPTIGRTRKLEDTAPPPRAFVAEAKHIIWQSERLTKVEDFTFNISIYDYPGKCLRLYFSGNTCMFVEELTTKTLYSYHYNGRAHAMAALKNNKIMWAKVINNQPP